MQSRWTSKAAWVSIFGLIGLVLGNYGLYEKMGLTGDTFQTIVSSVLGILTTFGILNDPTNPNGF